MIDEVPHKATKYPIDLGFCFISYAVKFRQLFGVVLLLFVACSGYSQSKNLPNILWIVSEDNSPLLGCYGDTLATTPHIDSLASKGHLYTHAYANAPVCAPARNTIITGVYANSNGHQHMRSNYAKSEVVKFFPEYLKNLGYYCTNNSKKDYNTSTPDQFWDESSLKAHYSNRKEDQPFFHVYNTSLTHESSLHRKTPSDELIHRPEDVNLPPYHPDTEELRHDWAQYYDRVTLMDERVGEIIQELEESVEAENTIVFYFSDHGGVLARSKRFLYETGTHVPFIVRMPEQYKNYRPSPVGEAVDRLISFVDLAPTMLSLAAIPAPHYMQGTAFLGKEVRPEEDYVFMFRGRMDEKYDLSRAVRNKKFRYIRNYMPHRIYGQYLEYLWKAPSVVAWQEACESGDCNDIQMRFWKTKPSEELYDTENDPWEVNNLAENSEYKDVLKRMREVNRRWMLSVLDAGFIPEGDLEVRTQNSNGYDYMRGSTVALGETIDVAEMASEGNPSNLPKLLHCLKSEDSAIRYWGVVGLIILDDETLAVTNELKNMLVDESADVSAAAAEALYLLGERSQSIERLVDLIKHESSSAGRTRALNVVASLSLDHSSIREAVLDFYSENYKKDRFRYDLRACESLFQVWGVESEYRSGH